MLLVNNNTNIEKMTEIESVKEILILDLKKLRWYKKILKRGASGFSNLTNY